MRPSVEPSVFVKSFTFHRNESLHVFYLHCPANDITSFIHGSFRNRPFLKLYSSDPNQYALYSFYMRAGYPCMCNQFLYIMIQFFRLFGILKPISDILKLYLRLEVGVTANMQFVVRIMIKFNPLEYTLFQ